MKREILGGLSAKPVALLVNPWIYDFSGFDLWMKPLGLLVVSGWLKESFDVRLVDCLDRRDPELAEFIGPVGMKETADREFGTGHFHREYLPRPERFASVPRRYKRYGIPEELFRRKLRRIGKPAVIGFGCTMTYWYPGLRRAMEIVREELGDIPMLIGGIYARLCQEHATGLFPGAKAVSAWQEDEVVREFCEAAGAERRGCPTGDLLPDYSHYGVPRTAATCARFGCPRRCSYCASGALYPRMVARDPGKVVEELTNYSRTGVPDVAFYDDALLEDFDNYLGPVLDRLHEEGSVMRLHAPNAVMARQVTPEVARRMRRAGFRTIRIGYESADEEFQKGRSGGKVSNEELGGCVRNLFDAGFAPEEVGCYVMAGLPGQEPGDVVESLMRVYESGARAHVAMFSPVPGSVEYQKLAGAGVIDVGDPLSTNKTVYGGAAGERYGEFERARRFAVDLNGRLPYATA